MLTYALIIFAIAAVGGLVLASKILMGQQPPWLVSIIHALLGAAGLVMLLMVLLEGNGTSRLTAAFALLVIAALGGFYLASVHLKKKLPSKAIVGVHAGVAVLGFLTLASIVFEL